MEEIEIKWALQELAAMGYIEYSGDKFYISDKGNAHAEYLLNTFKLDDHILILLHCTDLASEVFNKAPE